MNRIRLSELNKDHLKNIVVWRVIPDSLEEADAELEPAELDADGEIGAKNEEVWCACSARFSNGTVHEGVAMCRGDSSDGPLLWSIWNGMRAVPLLLPPAPPAVLKVDGPERFAVEFGLMVGEVFPIEFAVIPQFETKPTKRKVILNIGGSTCP